MRTVRPFTDSQVEAANKAYADWWYYYFGGSHRWRTHIGKDGHVHPNYEKPGARHFLRFVNEVVWTLDEDDENNPLKKFPEHKSYITHYVMNALFAQRFIVVPKSRRLMMTWINAIYCLWFALANVKRNVVWQAQKGDKVADTMENKILHVLKNLPTDRFAPFVSYTDARIPAGWDERVVNWYQPKREQYGLTRITFLNRAIGTAGNEILEPGSRILGVPEGENQTRQYTITLFVGDEFAFWKQPRQSLKGIRPTLGKNGQGILISSANPGFMEDLIAPPDLLPGEAPTAALIPDHIGVQAWMSKEGWFVYRTHYTADDEKRGVDYTEWPDLSKPVNRGDPGYHRLGISRRDWLQEYEIDFSVHSGKPFYPEYSDNLHRQPVLNALRGEPIILGFDFGLTPSTVICQITPSGHVIVVDEFVSEDAGIEQHGELLAIYLDMHYPWWRKQKKAKPMYRGVNDADFMLDGWNQAQEEQIFEDEETREMVISYVDPAGFQRNQTDMKTPIQYLKKMGFNPHASIQDIPFRTEATRRLLTLMVSYPSRELRLPRMLINARCKMLIKAMQGGCKQSKVAFRKEKNEFSHVVEALEYVCAMLDNARSRRNERPAEDYKKPFIQEW